MLDLNIDLFFQKYENKIHRLVEGQQFISTRKLADSDEEQAELEKIIDHSKPSGPTKNTAGILHYLLSTPFRYPPLESGCRFHKRNEQSIFYGSEELKVAMAEVAYCRFLFMYNSETDLKPLPVPYTSFMVSVKSDRSVFLNKKPFCQYADKISDPLSYNYSQTLGLKMRNFGVELFTYFSCRVKNGVNVGLFSPEAFAENKPVMAQEKHWSVYISNKLVEFHSSNITGDKEVHIFDIKDFFVENKFPLIN